MAENREMLALFDCVALLYARSYAEIVEGLDAWLGVQGEVESTDVADAPPDDTVIGEGAQAGARLAGPAALGGGEGPQDHDPGASAARVERRSGR